MRIEVVSGTGEGRTSLGAFDAALGAAGIGDYNLVSLSSVVPPGADVVRRDAHGGEFGVGSLVPVVLAEAVSDVPDAGLAAGLGWASAEEGGVFMEATASSRQECEAVLSDRLADVRGNRDWNWRGDVAKEVCEHTVVDTGAVVVAAVYGTLPLESTLPIEG